MSRRSGAITLILCALLPGCLQINRPPRDLANREVSRPARFVAATQPVQQGLVADGWLADFSDPVLKHIVDEAMRNNPDLRLAAARVDEARARVSVAASFLWPQIDGTGFAGREKAAVAGTRGGTATRTDYAVGGQLSWELDVWGRLRSAREAERQLAVATALDYEFARLSLAASVADAWFVAIQARQQLTIDRDRLETEQRTDRITRDKVEQGVGGQLDAELQEANRRLAADAVWGDQQAIQELTRALEVLLGRYPAAELALAADMPNLPGQVPVGLPSELLERRPDIRAADRRVATAFHDVEAAKAAQLPRVTLSASLGWLIDPNSEYWSAAGDLLAPLFDAGRLRAQVRISGAQQRQVIASYVSIAIGAFRDVETALANEQFLAQRQAELEQASARMRNASRIGEDRYGANVISIVELTTIRRQDFETRSLLLQVRTNRLRERLNLYRSLGGSFESAGATAQMQENKQ